MMAGTAFRVRGPVGILCSGVALGVYAPGLCLRDALRARGVAADLFLLEELFPPDTVVGLQRAKLAFHEDFRLAAGSHRIVRDLSLSCDEGAIADLYKRWAHAGRTSFIVLSGFWLPILDRYADQQPKAAVDVLHIDSVDGPSFRLHQDSGRRWSHTRCFDADLRRTNTTISTTSGAPVPFDHRARRLYVHGGGWGMGRHLSHATELAREGFGVDLVIQKASETTCTDAAGVRFFLLDSGWDPWLRSFDGDHGRAPLIELAATGVTAPASHELLVRNSLAIVSKPGGGTLLDSLSSATPVVFLEPLAEHEERNARFWEDEGLGIAFPTWAKSGYSTDILHALHDNLMRRVGSVPNFADTFARRLAS